MPTGPAQVREVVAPLVAAAGLELEDVVVSRAAGRAAVRVVVDLTEDDPGPLDLDRLAEVSERVSAALESRDTGAYTLEVSSPGTSRPLTLRRHFVHAVGRWVVVTCTDGRVVSGRLVDVQRSGDDGVLVLVPQLEVGTGRPPRAGVPVRVRLDEVQAGHVEVELAHPGSDDDAAEED